MSVRRLAGVLPVSVRNYLWDTRLVSVYKRLLKHTAELKTVSVDTPAGTVELLVLPGGVIDREVRQQGIYEPFLVENICEELTPESVFYDVGAQFGYFTSIAQQVGLPGSQIHAFEPDVLHRHILKQNHESRGVHISPSFVSDTDTGRNTTLDSYATETAPPDVVKIDVEGGEMAVLQGMRETCVRHAPTILCEMHPAFLPSGVTADDVVELLQGYGYDVSMARHREEGQQWVPLAEASPPPRRSYLVRAGGG